MTALRREVAVFAALAALAVLAFLLIPTYPNYDTYFHLVWGRELLHGIKPDFTAYAAPTQHPLYLVIAGLLSLFGTGAERLIVLFCVLALVALVWACFRLSRDTFGLWPAVLGAVLVLSIFDLLRFASRAYVDIPFLALVFWAAALEVRRRSASGVSGRALVMGLLVLAGLLRPEGWVLAGVYWLALWPELDMRGRFKYAVFVAVAPVVWLAVDFAITGNPFFSLTSTTELAAELGRQQGLDRVPGSLLTFLADNVRIPVFVAAVVGIVLAWRTEGLRKIAVPLALVAAGVLTFIATAIVGLSVLPRYLTVPTVALTLFAGYGLLGFTAEVGKQISRNLRYAWIGFAVLFLVGGAAFAVVRSHAPAALATELRFSRYAHQDLVDLIDAPAVKAGQKCGPLSFPTYRLVPDVRWLKDLPADRVLARSDPAYRAEPATTGVQVFVMTPIALERYAFGRGTDAAVNLPQPGFFPAYSNVYFSAYVSCRR